MNIFDRPASPLDTVPPSLIEPERWLSFADLLDRRAAEHESTDPELARRPSRSGTDPRGVRGGGGMTAAFVPTCAADLRDQQWLNQQVSALGDGIAAAREIWANWSDLRCVGRLHPGMTAGDFLDSQLGGLRLDVGELVKALPDMSTREIAKVAGVNNATVSRARVANATPDAEPTRVVGADGKSYPGRVVRVTTAEVIEPDLAPVVIESDIKRLVLGQNPWVSK